jgi:hypothetical protein
MGREITCTCSRGDILCICSSRLLSRPCGTVTLTASGFHNSPGDWAGIAAGIAEAIAEWRVLLEFFSGSRFLSLSQAPMVETSELSSELRGGLRGPVGRAFLTGETPGR